MNNTYYTIQNVHRGSWGEWTATCGIHNIKWTYSVNKWYDIETGEYLDGRYIYIGPGILG